MLSAFDSEDDDNDSDDEQNNNSRLKKILKRLTKTKKTRLFVATLKERYKLYEVQLLESNVTAQGTPLSKQKGSGSSRTYGKVQEGQFNDRVFEVSNATLTTLPLYINHNAFAYECSLAFKR